MRPRAVERPWGGKRLKGLLAASFDIADAETTGLPIGEAWIHEAKTAPNIILKWIDAAEVLSVQNHPRRPGYSKREAWYFVEPPLDGRVITGMSCDVNERDPRPFLEYTTVEAGQILEMPSGRVHALTEGSFVLEIQEPLDVTYRIYDWGRGRELHLEEAATSITHEPAVLHATPSSPGIHSVISRSEFTIEIWNGPCEGVASKDGVLNFVLGDRFMSSCLLSKGESIRVESGERAVFGA